MLGSEDSRRGRRVHGRHGCRVCTERVLSCSHAIDLRPGPERLGCVLCVDRYILHSVLSHDITLDIKLLESTSKTPSTDKYEKGFNLKKGTNRFCLAKPGVYQLTPVSCYRFEEETYAYDTNNPHIIDLEALDYQVTGFILVAPAAVPCQRIPARTLP